MSSSVATGEPSVSYAYDEMGRVAAITNALGETTEYAYDTRGNRISERGATYPVDYEYDIYGNKIAMTTYRDESLATGDTTHWFYDESSGTLTNKLYADGQGPRYEYDANGRLAKRTWARGVETFYAYDGWGNLTNTAYSDGTSGFVRQRDSFGRMVSAHGSDGVACQYDYDDYLRCTNETFAVGEECFDVMRTYDEVGRCQRFSVNGTNLAYSVKTRSFNHGGLVAGYGFTNSTGRGLSVSLRYEEGRIAEVSYKLPNGGAFSGACARDPQRPDLIIQRDYRFGDRSIYQCRLAYDALGRPTNAVDSVSQARAYLYNRRNELAAASVGTSTFGYAYDAIGNRTYVTVNAEMRSYAANNLNQYTQIDDSQMAYDADGNLTGDRRLNYTFDAENRMVSARPVAPGEGNLAVVNAYDHSHRRILKRMERFDGNEWQTSETHTFVYDGNNIALERIEFADGSTRTVEYFWGNDLSGTEQGAGGVEGLLAVSVGGVFYMPCYDHNGNIVCYVSESGEIAAQYVYDHYGDVIEQYGTCANLFTIRFSTRYTDVETGLISYLRRFYRPDYGRWLNRDPIEERGGENLYAFCLNSPQLYVDVNGNVLLVDSLVLTAVGGVIGGVSAALSGGDVIAGIAGGAVSGFCISICPGAAAGCGAMGGAVSGFISGIRGANRKNLCGAKWRVHVVGTMAIETATGALFGKVGGALGDGLERLMGSWTRTVTTSSLSISIDVVGTDFATSLSCGVSTTAAETVMDAVEGAYDEALRIDEEYERKLEESIFELEAGGIFK